MNLDNKNNSSTIQGDNHPNKNCVFEATTQQFRKYTTIEASRKIKPFFKNLSDQNKHYNLSKDKSLPSENNKANRQTVFIDQYLPYHHFNARLKSKNTSLNFIVNPSSIKINNTITIDDNSDDESNPKANHATDKKLIKENRSFSLKAYLDEKSQERLILPKIGKPQSIIQIVEKQFQKEKEKRKKHPRMRNIHQITVDRQSQNQTSELVKQSNLKNLSQRQVFKSVPSKQSLKPLLDLDYTSAYNKKRKIELMGMKLKPVQRQESKLGKSFENRTERIGSLHLLPSQLIYKNPKESIEKNVYQQLIKRVFSTS